MKYIFILSLLLLAHCKEVKLEHRCALRKCPAYYTNYIDSLERSIVLQEQYVKLKEDLLIKATYDENLRNMIILIDKRFFTCASQSKLSRNFHAKKNNTDLREIHETDRYFMDRFTEHYNILSMCYKSAYADMHNLKDYEPIK